MEGGENEKDGVMIVMGQVLIRYRAKYKVLDAYNFHPASGQRRLDSTIG